MQHFKTLFLAASALVIVSFTNAQSADNIINRFIDSIGGKDNLGHITSLHIEASASIMGNDNPVKLTVLNGKGYRSETNINGHTVVRVYTDKGGWIINPFEGGTNAQPLSSDEYKSVKDEIYLGGSLFNYAVNHAGKAELKGTEGNAFKIVYTSPDSAVFTFYIDTASYLLTKAIRTGMIRGQTVDVTSTFSDYRKVDGGIKVPYEVNIDFGGNFSMASKTKTVEINKPVDPAIFEMPK